MTRHTGLVSPGLPGAKGSLNFCPVQRFERPSTAFSDPDAADSLPASFNLALRCCESGTEEAH
jgi:hypothetical protein